MTASLVLYDNDFKKRNEMKKSTHVGFQTTPAVLLQYITNCTQRGLKEGKSQQTRIFVRT